MKKKAELVAWCESKLGTPYVYGAKGAALTQSQINTWAALYPSTFTASYIAKAKTFIGQACTDCSGLISWLTGTLRGSSNYKDTAAQTVAIGKLDESMIGWALWKSGHIGVYIGNGYCIEAKGINYGTVKTKVSATAWTHVLKLCDIDYTDSSNVSSTYAISTGAAGLTITVSSLYVRNYPKTGAVVDTLTKGTAVHPTGKAFVDGEAWFQIPSGWISGKYVEGWIQESGGAWWYVTAGYTYPSGTIQEIGGSYYAFDKDGWMLTADRFGESGAIM